MRAPRPDRLALALLMVSGGPGCAVGHAVVPQDDAAVVEDTVEPTDTRSTLPDVQPGHDVVEPQDTGFVVADVPIAPHDSAMPCTPVLTVNELQSGGLTSAGDEFVEIYNAAACSQSLTGWQLEYSSAAGSAPAPRWTGVAGNTVGPHGYFVIASTGFTGRADAMFTMASGTLAAAGGGIGIYDPTGARIDSVAYGTAVNTLVEGTPAPAPAPGQSIARSPDGHDTNANASDFRAGAPTPGAANP